MGFHEWLNFLTILCQFEIKSRRTIGVGIAYIRYSAVSGLLAYCNKGNLTHNSSIKQKKPL